MCKQCMQQIRDTIKVHTSSQIKDADIAQKFVDSAMAELTAFFQRREEHCQKGDGHEHINGSGHHEHHTHNEHHILEDQMEKRLADTRRVMLNAQKEKRKFKFMYNVFCMMMYRMYRVLCIMPDIFIIMHMCMLYYYDDALLRAL